MRPIITDVAWSVSCFVTIVSRPNTAEPVKMPFGLRTRVGPVGPDHPWLGAILKGKGRPIVKYRDTLWLAV